ncbi:PaaI family thioesterase [Vibrio sp. PP-XX7]
MPCAVRLRKNPSSLGLIFHAESDHMVFSQFKVCAQHQGYNGLLHGGIAASLADAAMTHCLFYQGVKGLTAELNMRFHHPIQLGDLVDIYAELNQVRRHIYQLSSRLMVNDTSV